MQKYVWETPEEITRVVAEHTKKLRKRLKISRKRLSEMSGVSYGSIKRFEETGRFDALRFNFHEKNTIKPHIYFDSDVAKWIEAVSYLIQSDKNHSGEWAPIIDEMVDCMEKAQREEITHDCRKGCVGCGVNRYKEACACGR